MHPQFLRQRHNVVALLQSGDGVLQERFREFAQWDRSSQTIVGDIS